MLKNKLWIIRQRNKGLYFLSSKTCQNECVLYIPPAKASTNGSMNYEKLNRMSTPNWLSTNDSKLLLQSRVTTDFYLFIFWSVFLLDEI